MFKEYFCDQCGNMKWPVYAFPSVTVSEFTVCKDCIEKFRV